MVEAIRKFSHQDKQAGDLIRSAEWNAATKEIQRLEADKVNRGGEDTLKGPLTIGQINSSTPTVSGSGSLLKVANSANNFLDIRFADSAGGKLELVSQTSGWNIQNPIGGKHLYLNRDAQSSSNVYIGRLNNDICVRGDTGNVGIGIDNPQAKLHVSGNAIVTDKLGIGTATPIAQLSLGGDNSGSAGPEVDQATQLLLGGAHNKGANNNGTETTRRTTYKLRIEGYDNDGSTVYPIYCKDENNLVDFWIKNRPSEQTLPTMYFAGNLGIGTNSPTAKLHVHGNGSQNVDLLVTGRLRSTSNDGGLWVAEDRFIGGHGTNKVGFYNGGSWRLTVLNNGNVGIGTDNPTEKLHVSGNAIVTGTVASHGKLTIGTTDGNTNLLEVKGNAKAGSLNITGVTSLAAVTASGTLSVTGATSLAAVTASGNLTVTGTGKSSIAGMLGIGTTDPYSTLHVVGDLALGTNANNQKFTIHSRTGNNGDHLQITHDQPNGEWAWGQGIVLIRSTSNVGIGTQTPEAKLHVSGNAIVSGNAKADSLNVAGATSLAAITASGNLNVTGATSLAAVTASGNLTVNGTGNSSIAGNLGIGITNPTAKLHVSGNFIVAKPDSADNQLEVKFESNGSGKLQFFGWAQGWNINTTGDGKHLYLGRDSSTTSNVYIGRWNNSVVIRGSDGNVGIGTESPTEKLHVSGNAIVTGTVASQGKLTIGTTAGNTDLLEVKGNTIITGNANAGSLNITGVTSLAAVTASGNLNVTGVTSLAAVTASGNLTVTGTGESRIAGNLQLIHKPTEASGGTLVLGDTQKSNLRLGYYNDYTWMQSYSGKPLALNPSSNNVGIGTTTPEAKLHVSGNAIVSSNLTVNNGKPTQDKLDVRFWGSGSGELQIHGWSQGWNIQAKNAGKHLYLNRDSAVNSNVYIGRENKEMVVRDDGRVGIGTDNPSKGKLHIEGAVGPYAVESFSAYIPTDNVSVSSSMSVVGMLVAGLQKTQSYSLYASHYIGSPGLLAFSDIRIKEVKGLSDTKSDLETLLQLQITDYTYKDKVAKDSGFHKKVLGQQVAEVFPQAVRTHTDVVPDIFQPASMCNGWVKLPAHGLQIGERVRLLLNGRDPQICTVDAITAEGFQVSLVSEGDVFVYGREVNDFHVVDYDALAMLNISATQELYKVIEALKLEVQQLKTQLSDSHHSIPHVSSF
jgi:hypothetical protein